jgi:hypothetical protein
MLSKEEVNEMIEEVNSSDTDIEWEFFRKLNIVDCFQVKNLEPAYQLGIDNKNDRVSFSDLDNGLNLSLFESRTNGLKEIVSMYLEKPEDVHEALQTKDGVHMLDVPDKDEEEIVDDTVKSVLNTARTQDYLERFTDADTDIIKHFEDDGEKIETVYVENNGEELYTVGSLIENDDGEEVERYLIESTFNEQKGTCEDLDTLINIVEGM